MIDETPGIVWLKWLLDEHLSNSQHFLIDYSGMWKRFAQKLHNKIALIKRGSKVIGFPICEDWRSKFFKSDLVVINCYRNNQFEEIGD